MPATNEIELETAIDETILGTTLSNSEIAAVLSIMAVRYQEQADGEE
jgi:hypothetical protein